MLIRIQEGKNDQPKYKREEVSYSEVLHVLHEGQEKNKFKF
jgi:hypothetical protein